MERKAMFNATAAIVLLAVIGSSIGCGIIRPLRQRRGAPEHAGFLVDYSQLRHREGYAAQEVYINPQAAWSKYDAVYIDSVALWVKDPSTAPSKEDGQMLTAMAYKALADKLGEKFKLVNQPGPGVLRIRAALTEAKGANVPLNAVTTVIPQLRVVAAVGGVAGDTAKLVGAASGEAEILDSVTNERLAAAVDAVAGTKGITRAFSKWADVENACNRWAERIRDFLVKQGVRTIPRTG
jgi:Protein of unknown function (DUF3313)